MAREWEFYPQAAARIRVAAELVAADHGLDPEVLLARSKAPQISHPRFLVIYLCMTEFGLGFRTIRNILGFDHATAIHAIDKVETCARKDPVFAEYLEGLRQRVRKLAGRNGAPRPKEFLETAKLVADFYDVPLPDLLETRRGKLSTIKHIFWYVLAARFGLSTGDIADWVGTDHSTVGWALDKVERLRKQDRDIAACIRHLLQQIGETGDSRVTA